MKTITTKELIQKIDDDNVHLIDVLEPEVFEKSHIQGAVNIPLKHVATEVKNRYEPSDELVVYCADADCTASPSAAKKLESIGFKNVYDYEGGKKAWKEYGLPIDAPQ